MSDPTIIIGMDGIKYVIRGGKIKSFVNIEPQLIYPPGRYAALCAPTSIVERRSSKSRHNAGVRAPTNLARWHVRLVTSEMQFSRDMGKPLSSGKLSGPIPTKGDREQASGFLGHRRGGPSSRGFNLDLRWMFLSCLRRD